MSPSITDDIDDVLDPILATFRARLEATLVNRAVFAYLRGSAQMVQWGRTKTTDMPIYFEGQPMQQAINYVQSHITKAKLVDGITASTKERLSDIIADGIRNKRGIDGIARDLRNELGWKGNLPSEIKGLSLKDRSIMIARTESADALEQSFMDRSKAIGVTGKRSVPINPCPMCEENAAVGVIPIDEEFPSGHLRPPFHPLCVCALVGVMLPE